MNFDMVKCKEKGIYCVIIKHKIFILVSGFESYLVLVSK